MNLPLGQGIRLGAFACRVRGTGAIMVLPCAQVNEKVRGGCRMCGQLKSWWNFCTQKAKGPCWRTIHFPDPRNCHA